MLGHYKLNNSQNNTNRRQTATSQKCRPLRPFITADPLKKSRRPPQTDKLSTVTHNLCQNICSGGRERADGVKVCRAARRIKSRRCQTGGAHLPAHAGGIPGRDEGAHSFGGLPRQSGLYPPSDEVSRGQQWGATERRQRRAHPVLCWDTAPSEMNERRGTVKGTARWDGAFLSGVARGRRRKSRPFLSKGNRHISI